MKYSLRSVICFFLGSIMAFIPLVVRADSCNSSLSEPVVDFGSSQQGDMERAGPGLLVGTRVVTLSASCEQNIGMVLSFEGERVDEQGYRFAQNGMFILKVLSAQVDGQTVTLLDRNAPEQAQSIIQLRPGALLVPYVQGQIASGAQFNAQVEVTAYVSMSDTQVRNIEEWAGSGLFRIDPL